MLRRTPTSIQLKLDDIKEYDEMRAELAKEKATGSPESPMWLIGPKTKQEIQARIGYSLRTKVSVTNLM